LVRCVLLTYAPDTADLVVVAHHLVVDEWAMELVARAILTGQPPDDEAGFLDWAQVQWHRDGLREGTAAGLTGVDLTPALAWGGGGECPPPPAGARVDLDLPPMTGEHLRAVAAVTGVTPYTVLLAAVGLSFARNCGSTHPAPGVSISTRPPRAARTVGYYNTMALVPVPVAEDRSVADLLAGTHAAAARAYAAGVPLAEQLADVDLGGVPVPPGRGDLLPRPGTGHDRRADRRAAPRRRPRHRPVPDDLVRLPRRPDRDRVRAVPARLLLDLVEEQVRRRPGAFAVTDADRGVTYADLWAAAGRLARALADAGVTPGNRVGVCLDRGVDLIVALLGVLRAGGAYVPLDPAYPAERLVFLARDAKLKVVAGTGALPTALAGVTTVHPDAEPLDGAREGGRRPGELGPGRAARYDDPHPRRHRRGHPPDRRARYGVERPPCRPS